MSNKHKSIIYLILFGILIFCLITVNLFVYFKDMNKLYEDKTQIIDSLNINYPYFSNDKDDYIRVFIESVNKDKADNIKYIVNYLGDYTNILFKFYKDDLIVDYHSILFNKDKIININEVILNEEDFNNKIKLYIENNNLKISDEELENSTQSYLFKDYELEIYYTNYNDSKHISLIKINYHEIEDYLLIPYNLTKEYVPLEEPLKEENHSTIPIIDFEQNKKLIAFTFDDGPSVYTLELLDILDSYGAKATFFLVGYNIKQRNSIVLEAFNRGHELGNHTVDHSRLTKFKGSKLLEKLTENNELYYNITNSNMTLLRPPYGAYNDEVKKQADAPIIMWSVDSRDWESRNTDKIVEEVLKSVSEGDIILFHDLYSTTIEAVKVLLPILYADDYKLVTVSDLFNESNQILEKGIVYKKAR